MANLKKKKEALLAKKRERLKQEQELRKEQDRLKKEPETAEKTKKEKDDEDEDDDEELIIFSDFEPETAEKTKKDKDDEDDENEDMAYADDDDDDENEDNGGMMTAKADDMITMDYLNWLEQTAKSQGHDIADARAHFDSVNKGYGPGESSFDMRGQGSLEGAGEEDSGKRPKMDFGAAPKGNTNVIKSDFIAPDNVSQADIEAAYEVYKAATVEEQFKSSLGDYFADRLTKEQKAAKVEKARKAFDARQPLAELQKAVVALNDRISNISSSGGEVIAKSASTSVTVPDTVEMADMSWDDVHRLADKALRGE